MRARCLMLAALAVSCDSSSAGSGENVDGASPCNPGEVIACVGPGGCAGGQRCRDDGSGYADCDCAAGDAITDVPADGPPPPDTSDAEAPPADVDATPETPVFDAPCGPVDGTSTDLYVDGRVAASGKGSAGCPFKTILEATAIALDAGVTRTIHVAGDVTPIKYLEKNTVALKGSVKLAGDGPTKVTLSFAFGGPGTCGACGSTVATALGAPTSCGLTLEDGASLSGVTVDAATLKGSCGYAVATVGDKKITLDKVTVLGLTNGIGIAAPTELTDFDTRKSVTGVRCIGARELDIRGVTADSVIAESSSLGLRMEPTCKLTLDRVTVRDNAQGGIYVGWNSGGPPGGFSRRKQSLTSVTVTGNGVGGSYEGCFISDGDVMVRKSTFLGNTASGLRIAGSSAIDLGTSTDPGGNVFGSATKSKRNTCRGVHAGTTTTSGSIPALGNQWSECPPTQNVLTGPCVYSDVTYAGPSADPLDTSSCTIAP